MVCDSFGLPEFLNVDSLLNQDSNIINRFLKLLNLPYCKYKDKIYHSQETIDSNKININSIKCNCDDFVFILNLIYYVTLYNTCMLLSGQINTYVTSIQSQKIKFTMITEGNIENVTLNENQTEMANVQMINIRNPQYVNTMSSEYTKLIEKLSYSYLNTYNMKPPFKDSNLYNYFLSNAEKSTMNPTVFQSVNAVNGLMTTNDQYINVMIDDSVFKKLKVNINQKNIKNIIVQNVSDNMIKKFIQTIFNVEKQVTSCSILDTNILDTTDTNTNTNTSTDTNKNTNDKNRNIFLKYLFYIIIIILLIVVFVLLIDHFKIKSE